MYVIYYMSYPEANPNFVRQQIKEIKEWMEEDSIRVIRQQNPDGFKQLAELKFDAFFKEYPTVFKLVINVNEDLSILNNMLNMIEKINGNKIDKLEGEKIIGNRLAEEYLYPVVEQNKKNKKK